MAREMLLCQHSWGCASCSRFSGAQQSCNLLSAHCLAPPPMTWPLSQNRSMGSVTLTELLLNWLSIIWHRCGLSRAFLQNVSDAFELWSGSIGCLGCTSGVISESVPFPQSCHVPLPLLTQHTLSPCAQQLFSITEQCKQDELQCNRQHGHATCCQLLSAATLVQEPQHLCVK